MITERLHLLSEEVSTKFTFNVDDYGNMVDLTISEDQDGIQIPKFAILVDEGNSDEKYVLSVLESPLTVYFGSDIYETTKVFVSSNIEEIFQHMKNEVVNSMVVLKRDYVLGENKNENGDSKESERGVADNQDEPE